MKQVGKWWTPVREDAPARPGCRRGNIKMKPNKVIGLGSACLLTLALAAGLAGGSLVAAQSTTPFQPPVSGLAGTIVAVQGTTFKLSLGQNRIELVHTSANTVVLKNGFARLADLKVGDRVIVNPALTSTGNPTKSRRAKPSLPSSSQARSLSNGTTSLQGPEPDGRNRDYPASEVTAPATGVAAGQKAGDTGTANAPTLPSDPGTGLRGRASSAPGDGAAQSATGATGGAKAVTAHLIWAPQTGEELLQGIVRSAEGKQFTLYATGANYTVLVNGATVVKRLASPNGAPAVVRASVLTPNTPVLVLGAKAGSQARTLTAKAVLIEALPHASSLPPTGQKP